LLAKAKRIWALHRNAQRLQPLAVVNYADQLSFEMIKRDHGAIT
jgi:hypothetical protein